MTRKLRIGSFVFIFFIGVISAFFWTNHPPILNSESSQQITKIFNSTSENCSENKERTKYIVCYKKNLEQGVKIFGLKPMMAELENRYLYSVDFDRGGINQCHDVAHALGQTAGAYSKDLNKTILECPNICTSGCFHGVVEGAISTGYKILDNIGILCKNKINGVEASTNSDCFHGLGHGVADISGFDLIQSLKYCDLIDSIEGQRNCGAGVIMELYEPSSFDHALLEFPEDIAKFCGTLWGTYAETCYITAGTHAYIRNNSEQESVNACISVPSNFVGGCVSALGQNMFFVYQGDYKKLENFCTQLLKNHLKDCYSGVIESSVMSDPLVRKGVEICSSFDIVKSKECFDAIVTRMNSSNRAEKINDICNILSSDKKETCLNSVKNASE